MSIKLTESDLKEIEWWARHYKDGVAYLTLRMTQYFEMKDAGDKKGTEQLEGILRASLPAYSELVNNETK
tara:strand:+ start:118 stop:327 length:210 start_codon:yes stop_codon:yes gene_type:complete